MYNGPKLFTKDGMISWPYLQGKKSNAMEFFKLSTILSKLTTTISIFNSSQSEDDASFLFRTTRSRMLLSEGMYELSMRLSRFIRLKLTSFKTRSSETKFQIQKHKHAQRTYPTLRHSAPHSMPTPENKNSKIPVHPFEDTGEGLKTDISPGGYSKTLKYAGYAISSIKSTLIEQQFGRCIRVG
ncbi:hypothetical protein D917_06542 [Trichinella nativa]|uniref:Uncharacterized protein n=1 Tax=Trichinella nativa TaxID=6335 RepID=A0A1Y3ERZ0_9BILA|nr:hypothetical protein D917_06542 [Trichinella nativa]